MKAFIAIRYVGNANSENAQVVAARKLVNGLKVPTMNGQADSVSGLCLALVNVGTAANASAAMAKTIAKFGLLVMSHKKTARPDSIPQR